MNYRMCNRCIMTEKGDPNIIFDDKGNCNYCKKALEIKDTVYFPNEEGQKRLHQLINYLKNKNKNKQYDCLMGISGGLDSCYLAYLGAVKWGLRIKAIHVDDGFDTEICKSNISKLCKQCNIDITYIKPDTTQYYDLCKAYMKAGVPNLAVPQDNVLFSAIYNYAIDEGIQDFLSGSNFALESILQSGNTIEAFDLVNIRDINRRFGNKNLDKLPLLSLWKKNFMGVAKKIVTWAPLNYVDYNRKNALEELNSFCGFEYYGSKHLENYYTGFLQLFWLPMRFNVDKRTSHLSSMIISNQLTRKDALEEFEKVPYTKEWIEQAISLIKEKLELSDTEFTTIIEGPVHQHNDYKTDKFWGYVRGIKKIVIKK